MSLESISRKPVGVALLLRALEFSAEKLSAQRRKGEDVSPFINHPIQVAATFANVAGVRDLSTKTLTLRLRDFSRGILGSPSASLEDCFDEILQRARESSKLRPVFDA